MRQKLFPSIIASLLFSVGATPSSNAADKLPFPDGSYAAKLKFCDMSRNDSINEYEFAFWDIKGDEISNYESFCKIRNVSVKGKKISFKMICESEGESSIDKIVWTKVSENSFLDGQGDKWFGCGKFVE